MMRSGKPRWKGILFIGLASGALLAAQARVPMSHGVRSILLVLWVLMVYGLFGLVTGNRREKGSDTTGDISKAAPREFLRIESPVEKVGGKVRPRTFGSAGGSDASDRKDEETEVH